MRYSYAKKVSHSHGFSASPSHYHVLLLITFTLYQGWRERLVEKGRQAGRTELLGIRKNLFLLMGNQEMFTALFGQRLEKALPRALM
jgi:hypothetical protein